MSARTRPPVRLLASGALTAAIVVTLAAFWWASLLPASYSVLGMGTSGGHAHAGGRSVTTLIADPHRRPDVVVRLIARQEPVRLASGRTVEGYSLNGRSPGPTIRARVGQLVQVTLVNASVAGGTTLHWHGIDVPNAMDGVAGVTQDAVAVGSSFVYRFVPDQAGTFWYHAHQLSSVQVRDGLLGVVVVDPPSGPDRRIADVEAVAHLYAGVRTVNGRDGDDLVTVPPGRRVRIRVLNTDNGPMSIWVAGAGFRVVAVDGHDLNRPTEVSDVSVLVTAGGRADLELTMPTDGAPVRIHLGGPAGVVLHPPGATATPTRVPLPTTALDLLSYGAPGPLGFDPGRPTRTFPYAIGRRPGFIDGRPGMFWTVNGRMFPDLPMFEVATGDVVRMQIANSSGEGHPMHLHGHHAVVLSRNGVAATGSPWWVDSLEVGNGESYEIAFVADNPGIWMDHCHNLPHAGEGLMAHLAYAGFRTPFVIRGRAANVPE